MEGTNESQEQMSTDLPLFLKQLREEFYAALERKAVWGKDELKLEFERAAANAALRVAEQGKR
jgi:hypothetical protein